jgi:hypothetical protein
MVPDLFYSLEPLVHSQAVSGSDQYVSVPRLQVAPILAEELRNCRLVGLNRIPGSVSTICEGKKSIRKLFLPVQRLSPGSFLRVWYLFYSQRESEAGA